MDATAATLLPVKKRESLFAWFELYMGTQVGDPASNTFKAKKGDLQKFIEYLTKSSGTDHPDQWTKSVTDGFLRKLYVQVRQPVIYGDIITYEGKVTEKDDTQDLVKIEILGTNQEGDVTTKGSAEVILPGK